MNREKSEIYRNHLSKLTRESYSIIMIVILTVIILIIYTKFYIYIYSYLCHLALNKHGKQETQKKLHPFFQFFQYFPSFNFAFYD